MSSESRTQQPLIPGAGSPPAAPSPAVKAESKQPKPSSQPHGKEGLEQASYNMLVGVALKLERIIPILQSIEKALLAIEKKTGAVTPPSAPPLKPASTPPTQNTQCAPNTPQPQGGFRLDQLVKPTRAGNGFLLLRDREYSDAEMAFIEEEMKGRHLHKVIFRDNGNIAWLRPQKKKEGE